MTTPTRLAKINSVLSRRQQGIVIFEDIHDPHNAAAVLRTMDGFGFQTAYFIFEKEKSYNPKKVGKASSSSANKWLTTKVFDSTALCLASLRTDGYTIYATHVHPERPLSLYHNIIPTLGPRIALLFGNEQRGISEYAASQSDHHIHIPMQGFVESFNISVCAALVLGEITRQRAQKGMDQYLLTTDEQAKLRDQWL